MGSVDVSIILPVYNETARLVSGLTPIVEFFNRDSRFGIRGSRNKKNLKGKRSPETRSSKPEKRLTYEIIMVDDGSNVPASEVINHSHLRSTITSLMNQKKFVGIQLPKNRGKGAAIAAGVTHAKGKIIVFMDIDGSVPIDSLPRFISALDGADIAVGSRRTPESVIAIHQPFLREFGGRIYTFLSRILFTLSVHDATCGFKAFTQDAARDLFGEQKIFRWAFDTELLARAVEKRYRIVEVPVTWSNMAGSKVKMEDTIESFFDLFRILWYQISGGYTEIRDQKIVDRRQQVVSKESTKRLSSQLSTLNSSCDSCGGDSFQFLFDHHNNWKVQQCGSCCLVQVIPRPTRKEVAALYDNDESHFDPYIEQEEVHRAYFKSKLLQIRVQRTVDRGQNNLEKKKNNGIARTSNLESRISLLDVGCLTGVLVSEAERMGMKAEGLDISKDAVQYCKKRGMTAYQGTLETFIKKHPRKKYDVVTALEIIEHEYSPLSLIMSMYTSLHSGGVAVVSTPNHGSWWRSLMGKKWPGYTHPEHLYFFDPHSLEYLFKKVGFTEVTVTSGDSRPFPLWFLFKRGADYFPEFAPVLKMVASLTRLLPIQNPINPWDDLLVIAKK